MRLRPPRAVIVDESEFFRLIMGTCLRNLDWDYACMESGYELIEYFMRSGEPFDLAFIDLDLPMLNGLETAKSIKLFAPYQKIFFMGTETVEDLPENGHFLKKPIDFPLLARYLQDLAKQRRADKRAA